MNESLIREPRPSASLLKGGVSGTLQQKNATTEGLRSVNTWAPKMFLGPRGRQLSFAETRSPPEQSKAQKGGGSRSPHACFPVVVIRGLLA
jgi:hypothetical protein